MRKPAVRISLTVCCVYFVAALSTSPISAQQRVIPDESSTSDSHDSGRTVGVSESPMYLFTGSGLANGAQRLFTTVVRQGGGDTDIASLRFAPSVVVSADDCQLPSVATITLGYSPCGLTNGDAPTVDFLADNRFVCSAQASKPTYQEGGGCIPELESDNTVLVIGYGDLACLARASVIEIRINGRVIELKQKALRSLRLITNAVADRMSSCPETPPN